MKCLAPSSTPSSIDFFRVWPSGGRISEAYLSTSEDFRVRDGFGGGLRAVPDPPRGSSTLRAWVTVSPAAPDRYAKNTGSLSDSNRFVPWPT